MRYFTVFLLLLSFEILFAQETKKFKAHTKKINAICYSPNGDLLATASDDHTIRIWSVETGRRLKTLKGHSDKVICIDFSPNGKELISGASNNEIKRWNISTSKVIKSYKSHTDQVNCVKFSPTGKYFISGSMDKTIRIWKLNKSKSSEVLTKHNGAINDLKFSPSGRYFASASDDGTIKLWSANSFKLVKTFKGHEQAVNSICFSHDSKKIYSASFDKTIKIWNLNRTKPVKSINAHDFSVNKLCLSNDNQFLFSASDDGKIKTWNLATYENIFTYTEPNYQEINELTLSPNNKILAFSNAGKVPIFISAQTENKVINNDSSNVWLVIVGISDYRYKDKSNYSHNDALRIYGFYKSPEGGALKDYQIKVITDEQANKREILSAMNKTFSQADENDVIVFYYSGHGEENGLVPYDANDSYDNISFDALIENMKISRAKDKVCIIDACYAGSLSSHITNTENQILEYSNDNNIAFLLSAKAKEQAFGYRNLKQGVFSYFFIQGLKFQADENSDNIITISELYNYSSNHVKAYTNYNQNPILIGNFDENLKIGEVLQGN